MALTLKELKSFEKRLSYRKASQPEASHIGLVQLSTDHSLERDWAHLKKKQASIFSTRVHYSSAMNCEDLNKIALGIEEASDLIATGLDMDVMAFGCTSASLVIGEDKVSQLLSKNRNNIPATNPWTASKEAFKFFSAKKIGVFSPYPSSVNRILYENLLSLGYEIPAFISLGISRDTDITFVSKESMREGLKEIVSTANLDLVFMSCTNLRILDHIEEFEREFNIPIVCSNAAMFWHAMKLAGKKAFCPGYGRLLNPN